MALAYTAGTAGPVFKLPAHACDCHLHVYDNRCAAVPGAVLNPPNATLEQYQALQQRLGLERAVFVTPSTYGADNSLMLAAVARMGSNARGVAVINGNESADTLRQLHQAGVRGIRLNLSRGQVGSMAELANFSERVAFLGWHILLLTSPDQLVANAAVLRRLKVDLVFDHMARLSPEHIRTHPAHALVMELMGEGKAWVKLSGGYIVSAHGSTEDPALDALARSFIDANADRVLWGSDWPHATASTGLHPMPDDARQLERLAEWAQDPDTLRRILVDNPNALYRFHP